MIAVILAVFVVLGGVSCQPLGIESGAVSAQRVSPFSIRTNSPTISLTSSSLPLPCLPLTPPPARQPHLGLLPQAHARSRTRQVAQLLRRVPPAPPAPEGQREGRPGPRDRGAVGGQVREGPGREKEASMKQKGWGSARAAASCPTRYTSDHSPGPPPSPT
jgi:hypothetical protein